jgi:hypothetical protein
MVETAWLKLRIDCLPIGHGFVNISQAHISDRIVEGLAEFSFQHILGRGYKNS